MRHAYIREGRVENIVNVEAVISQAEFDLRQAGIVSARGTNAALAVAYEAALMQYRAERPAVEMENLARQVAYSTALINWNALVAALAEGEQAPPAPVLDLLPLPQEPAMPDFVEVPEPLAGLIPPDGVTLVPTDEAVWGWVYADGVFTPPPPLPRVLPNISDRQFYQALASPPYSASTGVTMAEAKAAVKIGQLPAAVQAIVDAIPDETERDKADMLLSGATIFERAHAMVAMFAAAMGWTEQQVDEFWIFAASL